MKAIHDEQSTVAVVVSELKKDVASVIWHSFEP